jgi:sodium/potassium/calcium exchanger 6
VQEDETDELPDDRRGSAAFSNIPSIYRTSAQSQEQLFTPPTKREQMWTTSKAILYTLFPTLHRLRDQSVLGKIVSVIAAPAVMALTLTLPVIVMKYECPHRSAEKLCINGDAPLVEFEEEGVERVLIAEEEVEENLHHLRFNKWLMATQCILGPLFCTAILFGRCPPLILGSLGR